MEPVTRAVRTFLALSIFFSILGFWEVGRFFPSGLHAVVLPQAPEVAPAEVASKPVYRFEKVADGIYCAIGTGAINVICNSAVIIGEDEVVIVDSGTSPRAARALLKELKTITSKPVRYLVNTHFHFDHTFGNQAFPSDVSIIAHEYTREKMAADPLHERSYTSYTSSLPAQIAALKQEAAEQKGLTRQGELIDRASFLESYREDLLEVVPRPPSLTVRDKLTIHLGVRQIEILHFGRGHTGGDVVVYLPKERVVCTGDLYNGYIGNMSDAYLDEWITTLGELAKLDFETVIPGHGKPFRDKAKIAQVQECMRDIWRQATDLWQQGVPAEDAARQINLSKYAEHFPQFRNAGLSPIAVTRIYELINERSKARDE
jgi:glyoxylase-like metal-dependent hydrolase (beta-lactamase superfamily II)